MITMRAKMRVSNVQKFPDTDQETLTLDAVGKSSAYPADGSDEDNSYAHWTPSGFCRLSITNPALYGKFAIGDKFYLDFTPAN